MEVQENEDYVPHLLYEDVNQLEENKDEEYQHNRLCSNKPNLLHDG